MLAVWLWCVCLSMLVSPLLRSRPRCLSNYGMYCLAEFEYWLWWSPFLYLGRHQQVRVFTNPDKYLDICHTDWHHILYWYKWFNSKSNDVSSSTTLRFTFEWFLREMSLRLLEGLPWNVPLRMKCNNFALDKKSEDHQSSGANFLFVQPIKIKKPNIIYTAQ